MRIMAVTCRSSHANTFAQQHRSTKFQSCIDLNQTASLRHLRCTKDWVIANPGRTRFAAIRWFQAAPGNPRLKSRHPRKGQRNLTPARIGRARERDDRGSAGVGSGRHAPGIFDSGALARCNRPGVRCELMAVARESVNRCGERCPRTIVSVERVSLAACLVAPRPKALQKEFTKMKTVQKRFLKR